MSSMRIILWDQLSESISSLKGYIANTDVIFMCEVDSEATYVKTSQKENCFFIVGHEAFC